MAKTFLERKHTDNKDFSYQKGVCKLTFSLRTDIKQELKDFKEMLEAAIIDVDEEIKKVR